MRDMVKVLRRDFSLIPDHRANNITHRLEDILISAFAMYALKYPSLLSFEEQTPFERQNLKELFELDRLCSDSQMRNVLDDILPESLVQCFPKCFEILQQLGVLRPFLFRNKHFLVSIDGVHFFHSTKISCQHCQVTNHQNGELSYNHSMLGAVLVHPFQKEVFPLACEAIQKQDGATKNDCELNAAKRLLNTLDSSYADLPIALLGDALFANEPHLMQILANGWEFITSIKPTHHKHLFKLVQTRYRLGKAKSMILPDGRFSHHFLWDNNLPLNQNGHFRVNFLYYEQRHPDKKTLKFSWVTSFKLRKDNVYHIMRGGRSRWKIENETFNTLKNQGYHFEHNFGHGYNHLCNVLALIMFLAFLVDQMIQTCSKDFRDLWAAAKAKSRLWERMRALFSTTPIHSFDELYHKLAYLHEIQLE